MINKANADIGKRQIIFEGLGGNTISAVKFPCYNMGFGKWMEWNKKSLRPRG